MKAHIVYRYPGHGDILGRLARTLAVGTGWGLSEHPVRHVDLNLFAVYIDYAERYTDWHQTPVGCYFSHYEHTSPHKVFWWELAAGNADVGVLTARQYAERLELPTFVARPPVDGIFTIHEGHEEHKGEPRIGLSGFIEGKKNSRKGVHLAARLAGEERPWELVASGEGWPVQCRQYDLCDLPEFYRGLDVLLCTSLIEGVPMPPLEALACGTKVVIPRGVGMLDDLPAVAGICRYEAGDYDGMVRAIEEALETRAEPEELAGAVAGYSAESWCADHVAGLEKALAAAPAAVIESDRHGRKGAYYVAYGKQSRSCAKAAIASFKAHMPGIPVAAASTEPVEGADLFVDYPDQDIGARAAKTRIYDLAPADWQYVLYLDADTEVIAPIHFLFGLLEDGWDMVICKNPGEYHLARRMERSDNKDEVAYTFGLTGTDELIQLNGGVFAFQRNARTAAFFHAWYEEWLRYGKRDQGALLRALFAHPVKLYVLGNEWNTITRYDKKETSAGILHYPMTARRWRGKVIARSDSPEAWKIVAQYEKGQ